eukprot:TRINITY_DN2520_c0_g1_i3.p1 TRINITY_DN2520_c0_g1~~TRINITY_DN2520_c0_g1_i3.p1  ORF type:complete len:217 (-),score=31.67 TRINITY_DN2520_c0_g1_i3:29-679(-)
MSQINIRDQKIVSQCFKLFDKDEDGYVDFREFASGLSVLTRGTLAQKYEFAFRIWDSDRDGHLSKDEYKQFMRTTQSLKEVDNNVFEQIFASVDLDGNGKISFEECKKGIAKHQLISFPLLFEDLSAGSTLVQEEREILALIGEKVYFKEGETIYKQSVLGDRSNSWFYLLLQGRVVVSIVFFLPSSPTLLITIRWVVFSIIFFLPSFLLIPSSSQ